MARGRPAHTVLGALAVVALLAGCGSGDPEPASAPAPALTPELPPLEDPGIGDTEAEYHQPPMPPFGGVGDTITLTGTNLGVRMRVTVDGLVDPVAAEADPGKRFVGIELRMRNTGIAIYESELREAIVRYGAGRRARVVLGVEAGCSNGFDGLMRIEVGHRARGCILFELPEGESPRTLKLALEQNPAAEGGRWSLRG